MTITEFLVEIERVRGEPCPGVWGGEGARFHLTDECIESDNEDCLISEVAWRQDNEICEIDVHARGKKLGLNSRTIKSIIDAADGRTNGRLRKRLLKACGIQSNCEPS